MKSEHSQPSQNTYFSILSQNTSPQCSNSQQNMIITQKTDEISQIQNVLSYPSNEYQNNYFYSTPIKNKNKLLKQESNKTHSTSQTIKDQSNKLTTHDEMRKINPFINSQNNPNKKSNKLNLQEIFKQSSQYQYQVKSIRKQVNIFDFSFGQRSVNENKFELKQVKNNWPTKTNKNQQKQVNHLSHSRKSIKQSERKDSSIIRQEISKRNIFGNLIKQDYKYLNTDINNIQLLNVKKKNVFMDCYIRQDYEVKDEQLRRRIKQGLRQMMQIRKGKYLINIIQSQVLEEIIKVNDLEQKIDEQIQDIEERINQHNQQQQQQKMRLQYEQKYEQNKNDQVQNDDNNENNKYGNKKYGNKKYGNEVTNNQQLIASYQQTYHQQHTFNEQGSIQLNLDLQLQHLNKQLLYQQNQVNSFTIVYSQLMSQLYNQSQTLSQLTNHYSNHQCQFNTFSFHKDNQLQSLDQSINRQSQMQTSLNYQIKSIQSLISKSLTLFIQNLFNLFYLQLQLLSHQSLYQLIRPHNKQITNKPKYLNHQKQYILLFYQQFIHKLINPTFNQSNLNQISSNYRTYSISPSQYQSFFLSLLQKMEKMLRIFMCVKIQLMIIETYELNKLNTKLQLPFISYFYQVLDTNSYHSSFIKQLFGFNQQLIPFGKKLFTSLKKSMLQQIKQLKQSEKQYLEQQRNSFSSLKEQKLYNQVEQMLKKCDKRKQIQKEIKNITAIISQTINSNPNYNIHNQQNDMGQTSEKDNNSIKMKKINLLIQHLFYQQ